MISRFRNRRLYIIDFDVDRKKDILYDKSAIYFIKLNDKIVYVGFSKRFRYRICAHVILNKIIKHKHENQKLIVGYYKTKHIFYEADFISKYKPVFNINSNPGFERKSNMLSEQIIDKIIKAL